MNSSANEPLDEVAQAEAELRAAQEKLAAAKARRAASGGSQAAQTPGTGQPVGGSQTPYSPPNYDYRRQAYAEQPVIAKDHVAAGLLAIFLGMLGVHKFYLGYNTAGFVMLAVTILGGIFTLSIASWVVWVIAVIEGVIYLTKSQSDFEQIYVMSKREWF